MKKRFLSLSTVTLVFCSILYTVSSQSSYKEKNKIYPQKLSVSVLEIVEPEEGESNKTLKNIIQTSAEISLRAMDLNTYIYSQPFDYLKTLASQKLIEKFLNKVQDDFVLIITYSSIEKNRVKLTIYWLNKERGKITKNQSGEVYLNFEFDRNVSHLINKLLKDVKGEINVLKERIKTASHSAEKKISTSKKIPPNSINSIKPVKRKVNPVPNNFYLISLGFSPFIPTGQAQNYFYLGITPTINISYHSKIPTGFLGLGIMTSLNYFFAIGFNAAADTYLTQLGTNISYVSDPLFNLPLGLFLYVAEGPAVLTVNLNRHQIQSTVLGFAKAGIGIVLFLNPESGLIIDINYGISIGANDTITGTSPELLLYTKM